MEFMIFKCPKCNEGTWYTINDMRKHHFDSHQLPLKMEVLARLGIGQASDNGAEDATIQNRSNKIST